MNCSIIKSKHLKQEESDSEDEGACAWCCCRERKEEDSKDKKRDKSAKKEEVFFNYGVGVTSYFELQWGLIRLFFFLSILASL